MTAKAPASTSLAVPQGAAGAVRLKWHDAIRGRAAMLAPSVLFAPMAGVSGPRTLAGRLEQSTSLWPAMPVGQGLLAGADAAGWATRDRRGAMLGPAPPEAEVQFPVPMLSADRGGTLAPRGGGHAGRPDPDHGVNRDAVVPDSARRAAPLRIADRSGEAGPPHRTAASPAIRSEAAGSPGTHPLMTRVILIGASTGGVQALERILPVFPADCPPVVIVQHMPAEFLASFVHRLDQAIAPSVRLAEDGMAVRPGRILLAPGGSHLRLVADPSLHCVLTDGPPRNGHRPSIDETFDSARPFAGQVAAALLTGMGRDGAGAMRGLRAAGARTIAQDQASSAVWGMPRAAWIHGAAEMLVPLARIADCLMMLSGGVARGRLSPG